jgi:eukaryotic-like serine/threonine-protein kinase
MEQFHEALKIKKYRILRRVGNEKKRKFNEIFLVENEKKEAFICKILNKQNAPAYIQHAFIHESKLKFQSEYLPQNEDLFEANDFLFSIIKYKNGETLDHFWKKIPSKKRIIFIKEFFQKIELVFEELRLKKIIHNDIKPSNILIEGELDNFQVHLIDFGLSFYEFEIPKRKVIFSLGFSAPEIILNKLELANHSSDLFSLACTFYFLLSGKPAFNHANPAIMTNLQLTYPLMNDAKIDSDLFEILKKMTSKGNFTKPPQTLKEEEIIEILLIGIKSRYQNIEEINLDLKNTQEKKINFFQGLIQVFSKS